MYTVVVVNFSGIICQTVDESDHLPLKICHISIFIFLSSLRDFLSFSPCSNVFIYSDVLVS